MHNIANIYLIQIKYFAITSLLISFITNVNCGLHNDLIGEVPDKLFSL